MRDLIPVPPASRCGRNGFKGQNGIDECRSSGEATEVSSMLDYLRQTHGDNSSEHYCYRFRTRCVIRG